MDTVQLKNTMLNLKKNQFDPYFVNNRKEVVQLIRELVPVGSVVANGGSVSLQQCGVLDLLAGGEYQFVDRRQARTEEDLRDFYIRSYGCDAFFCSSNAVTEDGYLYNVDGNSNRIACIAYGPKQVIMVVGRNKVVQNLEEAVLRVKTHCAPYICKTRRHATYCASQGQCVSLRQEASAVCHGCDSEQRVCCNYLISGRQRHKNRIKIILVDEDLGY